jgi:hypothetical protein
VNEIMVGKRDRTVKAKWEQTEPVTAFGGVALAERLACKTRLWSDMRRLMPERCKSGAGYGSVSVAAAIVHGLLTGSRGTYAAEPLRGDDPLKRLLGLEQGVAEEATVHRALGQWAAAGGIEAGARVQLRQVRRLIERTERPSLLLEGLMPVFGDGTWLEVGRDSAFEGKKTFDGSSKLILSTLWVGPYLAGQSFAARGEDERAATGRLIEPVWKEVLGPLKLRDRTLFLLDSLYGDGPFLDDLEACEGSRHIVGADKLADVGAAAAEQPEAAWLDTGPNRKRGWAASGLCVHTYQAAGWARPRTVVTRRFKPVGEMFWRYRSVFTNLEPDDPRIAAMMRSRKIGFARAVWLLYDHKQAMENQFKDPLRDLGLHHPPCRELARNAMFYTLAAIALNLTVGLRAIALGGAERRMRLWRLRRELFAVAARVATHAGQTIATMLGADARVRRLWINAMAKLEAT